MTGPALMCPRCKVGQIRIVDGYLLECDHPTCVAQWDENGEWGTFWNGR